MSAFSDYLEAAIAGWLNGQAMPAPPAALWVAIFNGDPTDAGTGGTEVTSTIRPAGRVTGSFNRTGGVLTSSAVVGFGTAAGLTPISHIGVYDAATAGNLLLHGPLQGGAQQVSPGNEVTFPAGSLVLSVA